MAMTKQRKMLIGVLCLGLGGLAVDRFVIGMPDSASASEQEVAEPVEQAPPAFTPSTASTPEPEQAAPGGDEAAQTLPSYALLSERLAVATQKTQPQSGQREDPFALPKPWQSDRATSQATPGEEAGTQEQVRFNERFKLDGTVRSNINGKDELLAVITGEGLDSRAIRKGQVLRVPNPDGVAEAFQLVEVGPRIVVWKLLRTEELIEMQVEEDL